MQHPLCNYGISYRVVGQCRKDHRLNVPACKNLLDQHNSRQLRVLGPVLFMSFYNRTLIPQCHSTGYHAEGQKTKYKILKQDTKKNLF